MAAEQDVNLLAVVRKALGILGHRGGRAVAQAQTELFVKEFEDRIAAPWTGDPVQEVLDAQGWNITHAARVLGVDRATLYSKIRRYELQKRADGS